MTTKMDSEEDGSGTGTPTTENIMVDFITRVPELISKRQLTDIGAKTKEGSGCDGN